MLGVDSGAKADIHMDQGEKLMIGDIELECRKTPGHTNGETNSNNPPARFYHTCLAPKSSLGCPGIHYRDDI